MPQEHAQEWSRTPVDAQWPFPLLQDILVDLFVQDFLELVLDELDLVVDAHLGPVGFYHLF